MQRTAASHFRTLRLSLYMYVLLLLVPVCKAQAQGQVMPCRDGSRFSDNAPAPPQTYTFSTAVATISTTFCPSSMLSGIGNFGSWVFTPEEDTNGTYFFVDPLERFSNVCVFNDAGTALLTINLVGVSLDPRGEVFISFISTADRRANITVRYGPGGFSTVVEEAVLDLSTEDVLPSLWNSTGLDRTNEVLLCEERDGRLVDVPSFMGSVPQFRIDSDRLQECGMESQSPPTNYTIFVTDGATPVLRVYNFVLRWPRMQSCDCSCTDCSGCSSNQSAPVIITVTDSNPTTDPPVTSSAAPSPSPTPGTSGPGTEETVGIAVGVVVVVVMVVVVVVLIVYVYLRRRRKRKGDDNESPSRTNLQLQTNVYHYQPPVQPQQQAIPMETAEDEPDYVPPQDPERTITVMVDKQLEKAEWLEEFTMQLGVKHNAKVIPPSFTSERLMSELPNLLQDPHFECLYLLWQGSLEQQRENGTNGSSHLPIWRIAQESVFREISEKVVWVQFGVSSPSALELAYQIQVVNYDHLPGDGVSARRYADEVFKSVEPRLKEKVSVQDRVQPATTNKLLEKVIQGHEVMIERIENFTELQKHNTEWIAGMAQGIDEVKEITKENLATTRRVVENQEEASVDHSPVKLTT